MQEPNVLIPPGIDFYKILQQSPLFALIIILAYFYRRDTSRYITELEKMELHFTSLVEQNIKIIQELISTNARLARAIEYQNNRTRRFNHEES